jgi:hypothetical protein
VKRPARTYAAHDAPLWPKLPASTCVWVVDPAQGGFSGPWLGACLHRDSAVDPYGVLSASEVIGAA